MTQRINDLNGWTYIARNPISKAGVFPYGGFEIPGAPEPGKIYNVLRSPEELQKSASTFGLIPIRDDHLVLGEKGISTDDEPIAGFTGENVEYDHPYLYAPLKITSPALMKAMQQGKVQLSPAYFSYYEPATGTYEGQSYDYIQRIKAGNHLALVDIGRTGPDVAVLDGNPIITRDRFPFETTTGGPEPMDMEQLLAAVAALSPEDKAQLLAALSPEATDENITPDAGEATDVAEEAEAAAAAAGEAAAAEAKGDDVAAIQAAGEAVETAEAVLAAAEELQEKIASDAMTKAVRHIDERNAMAARVKPFIGAVPVAAMDSAETIAAYALGKFGVKHVKGTATAVITGYLHNRKPDSEQVATMDAKPVRPADSASKFWKETA